MKTLTTLAVMITAVCAASAEVFNPIETYQSEAYRDFAYVDPMVQDWGEFDGFVFCDTARQRLVIHFEGDTLTVDSLPVTPLLTINRFNGFDLDIYVYGRDTATGGPMLGKITITGGAWPMEWVTPTFDFGDHGTPRPLFGPYLCFDKQAGTEAGVLLRASASLSLTSGDTLTTTNSSSVCLFDLDLASVRPAMEANKVALGDLLPAPGRELVFTYVRGQSVSVGGATTYSSVAGIGLLSAAGDTLIHEEYLGGYMPGVFVGDVEPTKPYDEVIAFGSERIDSMGTYHTYVGCFSVAAATPEELWMAYDFSPKYLMEDATTLVASVPGNSCLRIDPRTGQTLNEESIKHWWLTNGVWYEVGDPAIRRMALLHRDSLFVYEFDYGPTAVDDAAPDLLPTTFSLAQNYPNPFNGETVISFTNTVSQHLRLSIHNVLGQEVAVLHDAVTAAGDRSVAWNGRDASGTDVASGVYFARLKADRGSREIKMMYVK
jgi:hypothetical protein